MAAATERRRSKENWGNAKSEENEGMLGDGRKGTDARVGTDLGYVAGQRSWITLGRGGHRGQECVDVEHVLGALFAFSTL